MNTPLRRGALFAALALAGCVHLTEAGRGYRFSSVFTVTQTVSVAAQGVRLDFLASVRRDDDGIEIALFDPVFATPILSATWRQGRAEEQLLAPGARPGDGVRLAELLHEIFETQYPLPVNDRSRARSARLSVELHFDRARCGFPDRIALETRAGPELSVRVDTVDAGCGSSGRP